MSKYEKHIFICVNERPDNSKRGSCSKCGGADIRMRFVQLINEHGLKGIIRANKSGCLDVCELGPVVVIYPDAVWYTKVKLNDVDEIFNSKPSCNATCCRDPENAMSSCTSIIPPSPEILTSAARVPVLLS